MTGEMSQSEVTREAYPIHFAIADARQGSVHAFDQYQGPYVRARFRGRYHRLWLIDAHPADWGSPFCRIYDETADRQSPAFHYMDENKAADLALDRRHWRKVKRQGPKIFCP